MNYAIPSFRILSIGLSIMASATSAWAQTEGADTEVSDTADTEDDFIPAILLSEIELVLPAEAILHGIGGMVDVRVHIDATGRVTAAELVTGPELFHDTALETARGLRFEPARSGGEAVATHTILSFDYASSLHNPSCGDCDNRHSEMVIEYQDLGPTDTRSVVHIGEEELERATAQDLAETVSMVAGVTLSRGNTDTSKPIIRGLAERRLLIVNDGVRHETQKWGADHAPEIDPGSAGRITIIKGASGVRYGPDAIGGVILVEPRALRAETGIGGSITEAFATNGRRAYQALRLDGRSARLPHLGFRIEGNYNRSAALDTPDYLLGNTASETWNAGATVGYRHGEFSLRARYLRHQMRAGIYYGIQNSTPQEFLDQLDRERPVTADVWKRTYEIDRPYQWVSHDLALLHGEAPVSQWGHLHFTYAFQRNHREEFDHVRRAVTGPQYEFLLRTHTLDVDLEHVPLSVGETSLEGGLGVSGFFQENIYRGYTLIPNFRSFGAGIYAQERASWDRIAIEIGGRLDTLSRTAFLEERFYENHLRRGTLDDDSCTYENDLGRCPSQFQAASVSLGGIWQIVPELAEFKLDLSSASRVPNADEAYMLSSAPTFPVYVYSDPSLGIETTWGISPTLGIQTFWLHAEVSGYANRIHDFIYFAPELDADGEPSFDVTIRGAFPRYSFRAIDAGFHGVDGSIHLGPDSIFGMRLQGSVIRAYDLATNDFLVGTPPDQFLVTAIGQRASLGALRDTHLELSMEAVAEQSRVEPCQDLAPPPDGYVLFHASLGADLPRAGRTWSFGIEAHNLLNTKYREYTSLIRYYADQPGRDIRFRLTTDF